ncbi:metal-dependent hydrolase [Sinimarinibacterium sp. NLF-5-8]|uniref:metal-dependent hydrolase n=1 Tax=Sinimarinibacterium sp. NLF-5-8 TaxID=2698684 RepID=UPI00137BA3FC|nr:metal-dependent hydrolase [Sinimarinibacterium sp. NLF-5-8]QHS08739.1 metal-dependent hydrolase [Sinimarinibacterium sp. NLF-5-8]
MKHHEPRQITPRVGPELDLEGDIPRYWFAGDAFKTRLFDAMSLLFPEGEKFFISCVRDYREKITDSGMQQQVKDFIYQEGQHGSVHTRFNNRLKAQGIAVEKILQSQRDIMFGYFRKKFPAVYTLGQTVAAEHLTAMMAHTFFGNNMFADADPRIRAMYAWHAVEEIEHKAVAFDVFRHVAKGGYAVRALSMVQVSISFPLHVFLIMRYMFKVDEVPDRGRVWLKGLWWLYKPGGVCARMLGDYLAFFAPGFHPWQRGDMQVYRRWLAAYARHDGDAVAAADAVIRHTLAEAA